MSVPFNGIYLGVAENVSDPERLGRVKIRVPAAYGIIGSATGAIPVDNLPWALPMGLPAGEGTASGGMDWLPAVGDQLAVQFIDGEPEKPVWSWLMQTMPSASRFKLHKYGEIKGLVGKPSRGALTRYGHTLEFNDGSAILTTSGGYRLFLLDNSEPGVPDGSIRLSTLSGQFLDLDDQTSGGLLHILEDFYMQIGEELNILAGNVRLESVADMDMIVGGGLNATIAEDIDITGLGAFTLSVTDPMLLESSSAITVATDTVITLDYGTQLKLGLAASEPFVLGFQLAAFLESLLLWLTTHTHSNGNEGSPTGPAIIPPVPIVQPQTAELLSQTIFGQ